MNILPSDSDDDLISRLLHEESHLQDGEDEITYYNTSPVYYSVERKAWHNAKILADYHNLTKHTQGIDQRIEELDQEEIVADLISTIVGTIYVPAIQETIRQWWQKNKEKTWQYLEEMATYDPLSFMEFDRDFIYCGHWKVGRNETALPIEDKSQARLSLWRSMSDIFSMDNGHSFAWSVLHWEQPDWFVSSDKNNFTAIYQLGRSSLAGLLYTIQALLLYKRPADALAEMSTYWSRDGQCATYEIVISFDDRKGRVVSYHMYVVTESLHKKKYQMLIDALHLYLNGFRNNTIYSRNIAQTMSSLKHLWLQQSSS